MTVTCNRGYTQLDLHDESVASLSDSCTSDCCCFSTFLKTENVLNYCTCRENFSESCWSKPNLGCIYTSPIDLAPNGIPFGVNPISPMQDFVIGIPKVLFSNTFFTSQYFPLYQFNGNIFCAKLKLDFLVIFPNWP